MLESPRGVAIARSRGCRVRTRGGVCERRTRAYGFSRVVRVVGLNLKTRLQVMLLKLLFLLGWLNI